MLKILVLGSPIIRDEDQPVRIQRRLVRNMLLYLACQPEMVSRASLLFMFWEKFNEQDARRRLRETLSKLRSQLPDPSVLITELDQVGLDHRKIYVDLDEFKSIYQYAIHAGDQFSIEGPLPVLAAQTMDRAIQLWRGSQFLSGAEFYESIDLEQWVTNTQQDLSQKRRRLHLRMADHHISLGNLAQALDYLHPLLLGDELDPDVNFLFIKSLLDLGRVSEAGFRIQELENLYRKDLSMALPPLFLELQSEIRNRFSIQEIPAISKWNLSVSTSVPFFGLKEQLDELKSCFFRGGLALLSGEAGSGKTRLVYELYQSLKPTPLLLASSASSLGRTLPYQTLSQIIRDNLFLGDRITDPNWNTRFSRLIPRTYLEGPPYSNPQSLETPEDRVFLYEDMYRYLLDICTGEKLLIFLDNSQWLDESTMEFLVYLFTKDFFQPTRLLVLASRPDTRNLALVDWYGGLKKSPRVSMIALKPLDLPSIGEMAAYMLGKPPSEEIIRQLSNQSGGNPYFLIETLRIMRQSYPFMDAEHNISQIHLPKSIHVLVQDRLSALSRDAQDTLRAAAVIHNDFTPKQLGEITGIQPETIVFLLEELESAHFIAPSDNPPPGGAYNFIHEIIRENLYNGLSLARKGSLHQKVAQTLENGPIPAHPAILAYHFEAAGEIIAAIEYWIRAGEMAARLLSQGQTYEAFHQAEKLLQKINFHLPENTIYRLYSTWGELASNLNDRSTMRSVYQRMTSLGGEMSSLLLLGSGLSGQATAYTITDDYLEAIEVFEEAIQHLESTQNTYELIRSYNKKGFLQTTFCHFNEASISLGKAKSLGMHSTDARIRHALIATDSYLSLVKSSSGWPEQGIEYAQKARVESQRSGYFFGENRALTLLANANYTLGNYHKALEFARLGLDRIGAPVLWRVESQLRSVAASSEVALGHLDEGLAHLKRNFQFYNLPGTAQIRTNYHNVYGDIFRHLHASPEALREYRVALEGIQVSHMSIQILHRKSFILYNLKKLDEAEKVIQEVIELGKLGDAAQIYLQAELIRSLVYAEMGRLDEALTINRTITEEFYQRGMLYQQVSADWVQGLLEFYSGNFDKAQDYAERAIQRARHLEMIWLEIRAHELIRNIPDSRRSQPYANIQRIDVLLGYIQEHTKSVELRPYFKNYKMEMLNFFNG